MDMIDLGEKNKENEMMDAIMIVVITYLFSVALAFGVMSFFHFKSNNPHFFIFTPVVNTGFIITSILAISYVFVYYMCRDMKNTFCRFIRRRR
jgi:hypothetical protein